MTQVVPPGFERGSRQSEGRAEWSEAKKRATPHLGKALVLSASKDKTVIIENRIAWRYGFCFELIGAI